MWMLEINSSVWKGMKENQECTSGDYSPKKVYWKKWKMNCGAPHSHIDIQSANMIEIWNILFQIKSCSVFSEFSLLRKNFSVF